MLNNIVIGSYYPVKSKVHFMNPVSKIICTILYITMTFLCQDVRLMLLLTLLSVLMVEMAHLPKSLYLRTLRSLKFIIILTVIIYYMVGTDLETVLNMVFRLINIVLYTTILTLTTRITSYNVCYTKLLRPVRHLRLAMGGNRMFGFKAKLFSAAVTGVALSYNFV